MAKRFCLFAALMTAVLSASFTAAAAGSDLITSRLMPADAAAYYFIEEPVSLYADKYNLYVGGKSDLYKFDLSGRNGTSVSRGADAYSVSGNLAFRLKDGVLYSEDGGSTVELASDTGGIAADGNTLYIFKNSGGIYSYSVSENTVGGETEVSSLSVGAIAAAGGKLYAAVKINSSVSSVCRIDGGKTIEMDRQIWGVEKLSADGDVLCMLAAGSVYKYENGGRISAAATGVIDIAYSDGVLYALTYSGAVLKYSDDLTSTKELIVSASASNGFFNSPQSAATRKDVIAVADTGNDRVAVIDDKVNYIDFPFSQPVSAAIDDYGQIYAAHKSGLIEVFSREGAHLYTFSCGEHRIRDIKINSFDEIVVRADDGIYRMDDGNLVCLYSEETQAAAFLPDSSELFVLVNGKVCSLSDEGVLTELLTAEAGASDIALDITRAVYAVAGGSVYKYAYDAQTGAYTPSASASPEGMSLSDSGVRITLSSIENAIISYGDILLADSYTSAVIRMDAEALGVKMIDDSAVPPVDVGDATVASAIAAIYKITSEVEIYEFPRDMSPLYTLQPGVNVIVAADNIDGAAAYSYVVAEYPVGDGYGLVHGYVRKVRLKASDALPYSPPVKSEANIQNAGAKYYKYPSLYAPVLSAYSDVAKDTSVTLLDFAEAYRDCNNGRWYRISTPEGEAFIPTYNVTVNSYSPSGIRPQYNAVIIGYGEKTSADAFVKDENGNYLLLNDNALPAGTRVEVVGAFDPSGEYTQIRHYDEAMGGTLDCYVLTVHIKYQGVNAVQIIAFVLICITVIAAIILFIWRYRVKHRQLNS